MVNQCWWFQVEDEANVGKEEIFRAELLLAFKEEVDKEQCSMIIVDAIFDKNHQMDVFSGHAKEKKFKVPQLFNKYTIM